MRGSPVLVVARALSVSISIKNTLAKTIHLIGIPSEIGKREMSVLFGNLFILLFVEAFPVEIIF